jgi:hypothetical protein
MIRGYRPFKNKKFNFEHIVDSKQQIMDLGVEAYPMTILLDKECTECLWRTY